MTTESAHAGDRELQSLLWCAEDSDRFRRMTVHVESCELCQSRLEGLSGSEAIDRETNDLLSNYPWEALSEHERKSSSARLADALDDQLDMLGPPSHPELLGRLGRYEIERVIGQGGMGIVLKAHDTELNRPVAVKVLAKHLAHNGAARNRFARESRAAAAVVHEHVVAIHNVETEGDVPFLVMPYIAGDSLETRVERSGPLTARELLRIGIQAASGLAAAHEQGVVHRDVKPANILLEHGVDRALLTDFGLARMADDVSLTRTGVIAGTPHYMSPEQANGQPTDHLTDLFSLGSVLYVMAAGHPPFRAERAMGVLNRICNDRQKPLWQITEDVPDELSVLVDRLLEKNPSKRPASAEVVREQLTEMLAELQQPTTGIVRRLRRWSIRYPRRLYFAGGLTAFLAVSGIAGWATIGGQLQNQPAQPPSVETPPSSSSQLAIEQEAAAITASMDELRARLDSLNEFSDRGMGNEAGHAESDSLQSVHEQLVRLREDPFSASQSPFIGEHDE